MSVACLSLVDTGRDSAPLPAVPMCPGACGIRRGCSALAQACWLLHVAFGGWPVAPGRDCASRGGAPSPAMAAGLQGAVTVEPGLGQASFTQ